MKCMVCGKFSVNNPHTEDPILAMMVISRNENWQMALKDKMAFICCPGCIEIAFDENGRLGFIKPEYLKLGIPFGDYSK